MNVAERQLPHNLEAERSVLGAVLLHNEAFEVASGIVAPPDFFRDAHRRIFGKMAVLANRRDTIDLVTLKEELGRSGEIDEVGGPAYIAALIDGVPRSTNVEQYARIIKEKATLRNLIFSANKILATAYEGEEDAANILEQAERSLRQLSDQTATVGFESMQAIAPRAMAFLERMHATRGGLSGIPSGFEDLDAITRGFQPGTLVVLGARPGVGKTSLATNAAQSAAAAGHAVGIFSLEMPNEELFIRQIAATARVDSHRLQSGYIGEREWSRISDAFGVVTERPFHSDETPAIGIFHVRSRARRLKAEHGLSFLVIDYLQLMATAGDYDTRAQEVGAITSALKSFAKELKIPILLLSQLSRDHDKRGERPRLSDLKDSGSIEQDADIVLFLYRKEDPEPVNEGTLAELIIAKHRNGPTGTIKLVWREQYTRFDSFTAGAPEPDDQRLPMGER